MKQYDDSQKAVIDYFGGYALVLAAPGCGKTEILSQRILKAHRDYEVPYSEMLCVTFTNRASRDMKERIEKIVPDVTSDLYVGNLHRFCIGFLYENDIISVNTGILDDTDQVEAISEIMGKTTNEATQYEITAVTNWACHLFETENEFPNSICTHSNAQFNLYSEEYIEYKKENQVIDFDDILLLTYKAMMSPEFEAGEYKFSSYKWIQVDEVQDLNALQIGIIEKLVSKENPTVVFLGDERQAIYSFLGANHDCIVHVENLCKGNIWNLSKNYRAPLYLLDMLNDFAKTILKIDEDRLPTTTNKEYIDDALQTIKCTSYTEQMHVLGMLARQIFFNETSEKDSIGILVKTNKEADQISEILGEHNIGHIKLTKNDMFKMVDFKTLYSHFSVVSNDTRYSDWARLLYQTHVIEKISDARRCIKRMRQICVIPTDLMNYDNSSYAIEFHKSFENKDVVIFDTETTGLNVFNDDIIQIAAIKIRNGGVVPGSELDIIIRTDKEIPKTLKQGMVNPMVAEYRNRSMGITRNSWEKFMDAQDAFHYFLEYIKGCELLGHNVNYDVHILQNNILRRTKGLHLELPIFWDTLKMSRILDPNLRTHSLEGLLDIYQLEGTNSHNAMDDILATKSVARYLSNEISSKMDDQIKFLEHPVMKAIQRRMVKNYMPIYLHTFQKLYSGEISEENTFDYEFNFVYQRMLEKNYIKEISKFDYMRELFRTVVIDKDNDIFFNQQLLNHIYEFRTFNEADLYQNNIMSERVHVMTIHKAKGLEFENVLVFNVTDGAIPHYRSTNLIEDAKVLYVAMSRAKKRVWMTYSDKCTRFIEDNDTVKHHFIEMMKGQKDKLLEMEMKFFANRNN